MLQPSSMSAAASSADRRDTRVRSMGIAFSTSADAADYFFTTPLTSAAAPTNSLCRHGSGIDDWSNGVST